MKLKISTGGNHSVSISNLRVNIVFDTKDSAFMLLCVFVGKTLNKIVTMATMNGLLIICTFQN